MIDKQKYFRKRGNWYTALRLCVLGNTEATIKFHETQ